MKNYVVGYDLNRPRGADDYPELIKAIKSCGAWWHYLDSTWIIKSEMTAVQIRDQLSPLLDSGDELIVAALTGEAAWTGFKTEASDWLKTNL